MSGSVEQTEGDPEGLHLYALFTPAQSSGRGAPARLLLFPASGTVRTRDGRTFEIDFQALVQRFEADGLKLPIDINHATEIKAAKGDEAEPVGWIVGLEVEGGRLFGRVTWIDAERAARAVKHYPYVSPAFLGGKDGTAIRLKSAALVASPALAGQPAMARAGAKGSEPPRPKRRGNPSGQAFAAISLALGLSEDAGEAECLAAAKVLAARADAPDPDRFVPKRVHDQAVHTLAVTAQELADLKAASRAAEVAALIEDALKAKKILPALRDHYLALCETDEGLAMTQQLLGVTPAGLQESVLSHPRAAEASVPGALTADERSICLTLGISVEAFLQTKRGSHS